MTPDDEAALRIRHDMRGSKCPRDLMEGSDDWFIEFARRLLAERGRAEPVAEPSPLYYMRDNHTFRKLSEDIDEALVQLREEFDEGYTYGMLCTHRKGAPAHVHAKGSKEWDALKEAARNWYKAMPPLYLVARAAPSLDAKRYRQMSRNWYTAVDIIRAEMTGGKKNMRELNDAIAVKLDAAMRGKEGE